MLRPEPDKILADLLLRCGDAIVDLAGEVTGVLGLEELVSGGFRRYQDIMSWNEGAKDQSQILFPLLVLP